jgi:DNA-directed RNA polymerase specialized sigma24 family protein
MLRRLFRNLQALESLYESDGIDTITTPDGQEWTVWDLQYLYDCRARLSPRQSQAIELCLYRNIKEKDAALLMGIQESSPVAIYANNGLKRIIAMVDQGLLPKFRVELERVG